MAVSLGIYVVLTVRKSLVWALALLCRLGKDAEGERGAAAAQLPALGTEVSSWERMLAGSRLPWPHSAGDADLGLGSSTPGCKLLLTPYLQCCEARGILLGPQRCLAGIDGFPALSSSGFQT